MRLRSLFAKIVLWFMATVFLVIVGLAATSALLSDRLSWPDDFGKRVHRLQHDDSRRAYEEGGRARLADFLSNLDRTFEAEHVLLDDQGVDLATGKTRGDLAKLPKAQGPPGRISDGRLALRHTSSDDQTSMVIVFTPRFGPWDILPYFLWVPAMLAVLCYVLAVHMARPIRRLRLALERFGRGELGVRTDSERSDEIGELERAFDRMAGRIENLLGSERRLLQDVSHELRSPLARLGFALELARTSPDREAALARVRKEADRLGDLVGELLQLTRAEGDPDALNFGPIPLRPLLDGLVADCRLEADQRQSPLHLDLGQEVVIRGDQELIHRAVENVLRNAIRHAPAGTAIEVSLGLHGGWAAIKIRDFGPGVPEESLAAIFRPFFRVESDRGRASGGVGLGLAIASRAVVLHRGRITAYNASPGLCVVIELPVVVRPSPKPRADQIVAPGRATAVESP